MLRRLKLETDELVYKILSHYPEELWKSDSTTFFDPAIGGGQFVRAIEEKLFAYGHSKENIANRVTGYEANSMRVNYTVNKFNLVGKYIAKDFVEAEEMNPWFKGNFVDLRKGDAMNLPVDDNSIDVAAQNCLFNIFKSDDLKKAIAEMYRVLKPHGRLVMSDPTCEQPMNDELRNDERLRALCLSGSLPINEYVKALTDAGFGTIEIRARKPYRILDPKNYPTEELIYIESIEVAAIKDPMPEDGPCVFTGKAAIYYGDKDYFDDGAGHTLLKNQPLAICDKTALALKSLKRDDIYISDATFHYDGGGCC